MDAAYAPDPIEKSIKGVLKFLTESGKSDYQKFKPVLFEMPNYTFLKTGDTLGGCKSFLKKI